MPGSQSSFDVPSKLRYNHGNSIAVDIERAYRAAADHLAAVS